MAKEKKEKLPKPPKEPKIKKEKQPGGGRTAVAVIAFILALLCVGGGVYYVLVERQSNLQAGAAAQEERDALKGRVDALEKDAAAERNRESVVILMEPHALAAYMADSAFLYGTRFTNVRYESGGDAGSLVKLRAPVTVTIFNGGDQTITVKSAALYPWETVFDEGFRQETLAAQQAKGFYGELTQGKRDGFSIAPGESVTIEIDARLRGIYGHPALEAETQRFFTAYFADPEAQAPDPAEDVKIDGKGAVNSRVNLLFREALGFYCAQRSTRFTLTYTIETERGNKFSAACVVPF